MPATTRKISMSLPEALVDDLDYIAQCMGLTRSGVASLLFSNPVTNIAAAMRQSGITADDGPDVARRAVIQNRKILEAEIREMKRDIRRTH